MIDLYGIKNCDSVKKARKWLDTHHISYQFHDLKTELNPELLDHWLTLTDSSQLLNKRSTTWRQLPDSIKNKLNPELARETLLAHPTLIKRPVLRHQQQIHIGFKAEHYQALFKQT